MDENDDLMLCRDGAAAAGYASELRDLAAAYPTARSDDWRGLRDRLIVEQAIGRMANRYQFCAEVYADDARRPFKPSVLLT